MPLFIHKKNIKNINTQLSLHLPNTKHTEVSFLKPQRQREKELRERTHPTQHNTIDSFRFFKNPKVRGDVRMEPNEENGGSTSREEQEEALVALIEHRTHEVKNLRHRIAYYKTQVSISLSLSFRLFSFVVS